MVVKEKLFIFLPSIEIFTVLKGLDTYILLLRILFHKDTNANRNFRIVLSQAFQIQKRENFSVFETFCFYQCDFSALLFSTFMC